MALPIGEDGPGPRPWRTVGAVALAVGAVLALVATRLPLLRQDVRFAEGRSWYETGLWGTNASSDISSGLGSSPVRYGVPVVVAAVLLVVTAALVLGAPRLPARFAAPTNVCAVLAAFLLTGSGWTVGQVLLPSLRNEDSGFVTVTTSLREGVWVLALACVVALAGGLLVQDWPARTAAPPPRPGAAVVHRLPDDAGGPVIPVPDDTAGDDR
ncbi:hypothetical protein [Umezawaea sp. Da 62-37]|uniref:hypothetical protein n=1 Tax=Umezawaea sp. Da 62-37 TaxID=3075927 RepID=UPI0028F71814|nr:hypothetical protein [Umezawaea sp. Da 62-37]WNV89414.1 hypothetical protein RM788_14245 [Umezawaea sp. Da 62-37]